MSTHNSNVHSAAEAVVRQPDNHVLETRHYGCKPLQSFENGFRELQPFDLRATITAIWRLSKTVVYKIILL